MIHGAILPFKYNVEFRELQKGSFFLEKRRGASEKEKKIKEEFYLILLNDNEIQNLDDNRNEGKIKLKIKQSIIQELSKNFF